MSDKDKYTYTISNCCGASVMVENDVCCECKEHCEVLEVKDEDR